MACKRGTARRTARPRLRGGLRPLQSTHQRMPADRTPQALASTPHSRLNHCSQRAYRHRPSPAINRPARNNSKRRAHERSAMRHPDDQGEPRHSKTRPPDVWRSPARESTLARRWSRASGRRGNAVSLGWTWSGGKSAAAPATVSGEPLDRPPPARGEPLGSIAREGRSGRVDPQARRPAIVALTDCHAGRMAVGECSC